MSAGAEMTWKSLLWGLGAASALSMGALLELPATDGVIKPALGRDKAASSRQAHVATTSAAALPSTWPAPSLEVARANPFIASAPSATPPPPPVVTAPPPPPPPPPVMTYRYWGSLIGPDGAHLIYLARGDNAAPVVAVVNQKLEDGFVIRRVDDGAIELMHEPTQQVFQLAIVAPSNMARQ